MEGCLWYRMARVIRRESQEQVVVVVGVRVVSRPCPKLISGPKHCSELL